MDPWHVDLVCILCSGRVAPSRALRIPGRGWLHPHGSGADGTVVRSRMQSHAKGLHA